MSRVASEAEVIAINRELAEKLAARDARAPPPVEKPAAAQVAAASPAPDWSFLPADSAAHQYSDPTLKMIVAMLEPLQEAHNDAIEAIGALQAENAGLRTALAEMKAALAETRAKADTTDFVVQRLQVDRQGPPGPPGPMGRDGRDGHVGPQGPRGNRGQKSEICAWAIDAANYRATPIYQDNTEGVALNLYALFEAYHHAVEDDETVLAIEDAGLRRAALELETERVRRGLPAK